MKISQDFNKDMEFAQLSENEIIDIIKFEKGFNQIRDSDSEVYLLAFKRDK